ncbi:MAG: PRC-barrel domain-containing protein [Bacteroidales bacterium]|nr:PRC-barrel domain-containing protein [Bacteroidales bacterium]
MQNRTLYHIGKISKTFGYKGDMVCRLGSLNTSVLRPDLTFVFIEIFNEKVPYRLSRFDTLNDESFVLNLSGYSDEKECQRFLGCNVYIETANMDLSHSSPIFDSSLIGWSVFNNHDFIGFIEDIIENKTQLLILLIINKKDVYIPLVEAFVQRIDEQAKTLYMNLPDGLLDL